MFLFSEAALHGKLEALKYSATPVVVFFGLFFFNVKETGIDANARRCKAPTLKLDDGQMTSSRSSHDGEGGAPPPSCPSWMYDQVLHKPRVSK